MPLGLLRLKVYDLGRCPQGEFAILVNPLVGEVDSSSSNLSLVDAIIPGQL